jgi:hypothetical protein
MLPVQLQRLNVETSNFDERAARKELVELTEYIEALERLELRGCEHRLLESKTGKGVKEDQGLAGEE